MRGEEEEVDKIMQKNKKWRKGGVVNNSLVSWPASSESKSEVTLQRE